MKRLGIVGESKVDDLRLGQGYSLGPEAFPGLEVVEVSFHCDRSVVAAFRCVLSGTGAQAQCAFRVRTHLIPPWGFGTSPSYSSVFSATTLLVEDSTQLGLPALIA